MSVFATTNLTTIPQADLICALLLLTLLCMKIMTMKQDLKVFERLNSAVSVGLYPVLMVFGFVMLEWVLIS